MKAKRPEFWVVRNSPRWGDSCSMYNRVPRKTEIYMGHGVPSVESWYSLHGCCYLSDDTKERFKDITFNSEPVRVRLVRSERETPDFFIQKCGENLFIGTRLEGYWHAVEREKGFARLFSKWKWVKDERLPHAYRISPKAFKWVREEDGIIGMDIERIKE